MDYGLKEEKLYRIPATAVSYSPSLANKLVWWTGRYKKLPAEGGLMAIFKFADSDDTILLRPFAVVEADLGGYRPD